MGVKLTMVLPEEIADSISVDIITPIAIDSMKVVIKHNMELRADMSGSQVTDICDQRRMLVREAKKLTLPTTTIPLWNFLPILQFGVEYVHGAPPDMSAA